MSSTPTRATRTVRVCAVIACHNRVDTTLAALRALLSQTVEDVEVAVHVLDDASSDGTPQRVQEEFPQVTVRHGDGNLFWNRGMRRAWESAAAEDPDHYLWLNDDTIMDATALNTLLATHQEVSARCAVPCIVAGSTRDRDSGELTYGGVRRPSRIRPLRFELVPPADGPREVETMNGNCVLIPREVARRVGNLEQAYQHGMGDYDYGLRARAAGCRVWITPGTIATCSTNPLPTFGDQPLSDAWRRVRSVKGLPPGDWKVFSRRWAGALWPVFWVSPYVRRGLALVGRRS